MKTIVLFGGGGFVGGNIANIALRRGWKVVVADSSFRPGLGEIEWRSVDIADKKEVHGLLAAVQADAVVNVAAIADIDRAERERELAWEVNVEGAKNIAEACASLGAKYIFFSSDAVFDGLRSAYTEEDGPSPLNYYGLTKAEAEKAVLAADPRAVVLRISLVLGFPVTGGNSFCAGMAAKLSSGAELPCPVDEIRTPIDVLTLSESVLELAENGFVGLVHLGSTESISRYELTRRLAALLGYDERLVIERVPGRDEASRAKRHKNGIISVDKARRVLKTPMPGMDETIARALGTLAEKGDRNDKA